MVTYCNLQSLSFPVRGSLRFLVISGSLRQRKIKDSKLTLGQPTVLYEITYLVSLFSVRGSINRRYTWNPEQY